MTTIPDSLLDHAAANFARGHHWYDPDTLEFFGTRFESGLIYGRFFITSEQDGPPGVAAKLDPALGDALGMGPDDETRAWEGARRFTIRQAYPGGGILTVGDFGEFDTRAAAGQRVDELAAERLDYNDEDACSACLHHALGHHPDDLLVGCSAPECGCSRTRTTLR